MKNFEFLSSADPDVLFDIVWHNDQQSRRICRAGREGHPERRHARRRRLRPLRHSRESHPRSRQTRRAESHLRLQQRRRRRLGPRSSSSDEADSQDGVVVCRRERGVRASVSRRRAGGRVRAAGNARRADAGGWSGHSGILHARRFWNRGRGRKGGARI